MRKEPDKKLVGAFMVVGLLIFLAIIGYFVEEKIYARSRNLVVMFFDESVNGLNVGSPVVFKGVEVGTVAKIALLANTNKLEFSIPVYVRMEKQGIKALGKYDSKQALLDALIEKGLRARLATQSYVTGQLMIELEMLPGTPVVLHPNMAKYVEIPTALSPMGELSRGLQTLPIRQSVEKFNAFLDGLNAEMPKVRGVIQKTDRLVSRDLQSVGDVLNNLNNAMIGITDAARSFRNLTDYLERHPESLLRGKGGY